MLTIEKYYSNWRELRIHESSPSDCSISHKLKCECKEYTATQYYPDKEFGIKVNGVQNEDLENQTFQDEVFDIVITQDVMEHIFHPDKAFKEIARTLKKGGTHIFTVPIINKHKKTEVWAIKDKNGIPVFLKEPEYHLNPVDPKGSPVTMHWGFDIVDFIKQKSGLETTIEYIDDLNFGIRAEFIEVLVSFKK
jgi:SAM-dependent methyltransferase